MNIQIELSEQEATVLLNLLDVAVKAAGRQAAASVAHFEQKIVAAVEASKIPPATVPLDKPVEN